MVWLQHSLAGTYKGEGIWREATGDTHRYHVDFRLGIEADGRTSITFVHDFFEEETPEVRMQMDMQPTAPSLLTFDIPGLETKGWATCAADFISYSLPIPGNLVQASYFFPDENSVVVSGSSEKNRKGHLIMWEERLERA